MPAPTPLAREVLSDFLKSRRARLRPEDVGLPLTRHRRIRGLRREEVAALAGIGDTWYGLLESGKPIRISRELIENVAAALRLSSDEARYLQQLAMPNAEPPFDYETDVAQPLVREALRAITAVPAFIIGPRLDYLGLNRMADVLYRLPADPPAIVKNLALRLFLDPDAPQLYPDWGASASRAVAKLRHNYGNHVGNASFERLIGRLNAESPAFRERWRQHEVSPLNEPVSDSIGLLGGTPYHYNLQTFSVSEAHEQSLIMMLPFDDANAALLRALTH